MLVVSRKQGQKLVIAGNIIIEVVEVRGGKVRLGITAAREVSVHREDVALAIAREGGGK